MPLGWSWMADFIMVDLGAFLHFNQILILINYDSSNLTYFWILASTTNRIIWCQILTICWGLDNFSPLGCCCSVFPFTLSSRGTFCCTLPDLGVTHSWPRVTALWTEEINSSAKFAAAEFSQYFCLLWYGALQFWARSVCVTSNSTGIN